MQNGFNGTQVCNQMLERGMAKLFPPMTLVLTLEAFWSNVPFEKCLKAYFNSRFGLYY